MPTLNVPRLDGAVLTTKAAILPVPDDDSDSPNGEFNVILSTPDVDREGESCKGAEWKTPLPDHITFDSDHGMSVDKFVGSGKPTLMDDGSVHVKGSYANTDHAQNVRALVNDPAKHIRTVSVTFLSRKKAVKGTGGRKAFVIERELLNGSFVAVPMNPNAVIVSSKSATANDGADGGEPVTPPAAEMLQAIHNAAVHLGAECVTEAAEADDTESSGAKSLTTFSQAAMVVGKAVHGSIEDLSSRVSSAVRAAYGSGEYPWVRATFLDDGGTAGTVVYSLETGDSTVARGFTDDGSTVTLDADTRPVSLVTTVQEKSSAAESSTGSKGLNTAVDLLVRTGMTREDAAEFLGVTTKGVPSASSGTAAAQPAAATEKSVAAADTAAAVGLTARSDALLTQLDATAG